MEAACRYQAPEPPPPKRQPNADFFNALAQPWGDSAAVDQLATTAAPMLAGFSFALIGIVLSTPTALRWPDLAVLLLVAAGIVLTLTVQFGSIARRWAIAPADWRELLAIAPESDLDALANAGPGAVKKQGRWMVWTRVAFNVGLVLLLVAVAVGLVPPRAHHAMPTTREAAIALALVGAAAQAAVTLVVGVRDWLWNREVSKPVRT